MDEDFSDFAQALEVYLETQKLVYVCINPESPDHTVLLKDVSFELVVMFPNKHLRIDVNGGNLRKIFFLLQSSVFSSDFVSKLFTWNLKGLTAVFKSKLGMDLVITNQVFDLKILENFQNIRKSAPKTVAELVDRFKPLAANPVWSVVYKEVLLPLATRVLPAIESTPLLRKSGSFRVEDLYPYYEIEGQVYGRLNTSAKFAKSYQAHSMSPEFREQLHPSGFDVVFLSSDVKHCEATVLQFLSGDMKLKEILDSGRDVYRSVFEIIFGRPCDTDRRRQIAKDFFLPVMFGLQAKSLAKKFEVDVQTTTEMIRRIRENFTQACNWMEGVQSMAKEGPVVDFFGRIREFDPSECYKARNFVVQAVSATLCQEKLVALHDAFQGKFGRLAMSLHDGFLMMVSKDQISNCADLVKEVCESESKLCPGLSFEVEIKAGNNLMNMSKIESESNDSVSMAFA